METRDCLATETRCAAAGALAPLLWERGLAAALPARSRRPRGRTTGGRLGAGPAGWQHRPGDRGHGHPGRRTALRPAFRVENRRRLPTGHRDYLRYDHALEQGWPIATGIVEGTARHLVGDRLEITGARWGLAGAEAILRLRAVISNGDLGRYWAYHLDREHHRVHQARHRDEYALTV